MKFILVLALCFIATSVMAEERYVLMGKNNVEIQVVHYDKKVGGREVIVGRVSYGDNKLIRELAEVKPKQDYWTNLDLKQYRADKLAALDKKETILLKVEAKLKQ